MTYYYNDRIVREGRGWTDDEGVQHPSNWAKWSADEKAEKGLVWEDDPAPFDNRFYWDADTPKALEDSYAVDEDGNPVLDEDGEQVVNYGLKTVAIRKVKDQAGGLLAPTDWYITRKSETNTDVPAEVLAYRQLVRSKSDQIEQDISACKTLEEFIALHEAPVDVDGNPTGNPPITDWPSKPSVPYPDDGKDYQWNEQTQSWDEVTDGA